MTTSTFGAVLAILNIFFLLVLVGLGVIGILKTRGRARALVGGGVGLLIGAAIAAVRSSVPSATAPPAPEQPGYPGQPPAGWR